ncbi:acyl carrier protein [Verminephrobacter aporrectodeae]|uniref:acyl carrier protein n=1 Tax=Verminephrobacter aporrectodeae TaxID=1110389 RepID=UPI002243CC2B|nr:acyl carrier protein [Verminephrobacter aporrectodeae]MCW8176467.1 acyl carrier protein [Verminephrobacter aporrectodeae subsp. tuberculatae]MCW8204154.1 acyl carrier protein [Verminephrobacter aporrectodeae subsp. tuberculatae]
MTQSANYLAEVRTLIAKLTDNFVDSSTVMPETSLSALGVDSLTTVNLMVSLAETADVDLEDYFDEIETPATVGDLCRIAGLFADGKASSSCT